MYKKITLLIALVTLTIAINAQVKTNFNNTEKLNNSKLKTIYSNAVYQLAAPDLSKAYVIEKASLNDGSKVFYIAELVPVNIDMSLYDTL